MIISPEANACEIAKSWVNGNRSWVIDQLKNDHPGLTAAVIVQGTHSSILTAADCNAITNLLVADRHKQHNEGETT